MDPSRKTALILLSLSVFLGAGWGVSQVYSNYLIQTLVLPPFEPSSLQRAVALAAPVLEYFVTPLAFYLLGRRDLPGFRTGLGLAAVYSGSLVGMIGVQAPFAVVQVGDFYLPQFPFTVLPAASQSLELLFPAFSGLALARLSKERLRLGRTSLALPLAAMGFALPPNFFFGYESLSVQNLDFASIGIISLGLFLISLPVRFLIFYALGQMFDLRSRAFQTFGLLFLGAYVGAAIGIALAVGLFGQAQWVTSASGTNYFYDGIFLTNMSNSLVALLEGLNPISALPFLSFFGLTLSQVGKAADASREGGSQVAWPGNPPAWTDPARV